MNINKIAILASGSGTNAERLVRFFREQETGRVELILSNNKNAFVLERAKNLGIKSGSFTREEFNSEGFLYNFKNTDLIVLAGFLWLIPAYLVKAFPNRIVNIHPALLPAYGGKGMYGMNVHKAVIANGEKQSGISIHYVNEKYDEGNIIFQASCPVELEDTPESLAEKIHELEYKHFPEVVKGVLEGVR
ncbi:MAG: phosphoribosylglycinamide formyltransferase [Bacteroidales bacterium]|nr:phosphoribosylglycinamide formyltransferase [Bacteroidales bacterium]MCF8390118.1 phosphoribosylglycinamide formyltransferase [Bacteroidales bacterium]